MYSTGDMGNDQRAQRLPFTMVGDSELRRVLFAASEENGIPLCSGVDGTTPADAMPGPSPRICIFDRPSYQAFVRGPPSGEAARKEVPVAGFDFVVCTLGNAHPKTFRYRRQDAAAALTRAVSLLRAYDAPLDQIVVGRSWAMRTVRKQVRALAPFRDVSVMLLGESGTGKEVVAHALATVDGRAPEAFVALNCAGVPRGLVESTLFGHERGAYTDALEGRVGLMEEASGGTLFLDEVAEFPGDVQPKLLRVLEERRFRRLGANEEVSFDARVVSATNREVRDEQVMRLDLFHRLAGFTISIPPLRHRPEDILDLAPLFLSRFCVRSRLGRHELSEGALEVLQEQDWPGNARQLKAVVERLVIKSTTGRIDTDAVVAAVGCGRKASNASPPPNLPLSEVRRRLIERALADHDGNVAKAARALKIPRSTLRGWLRRQRD